jgi:hypothetical protein
MRHSLKISVMALFAMFAFSNVADAQFGNLKGLANKVKKAAKETVNNIANDTKSSVTQQSEATVSEPTSTTAVSESSDNSVAAQSSSSSQSNFVPKYEFKNAKQCSWTVDGDINNIIGYAEYCASQMQNSMKNGYQGLDYKSFCELMSAKQPLTFVIDARIDLGLGPDTWKTKQSKKDIDAMIWDFKQEAWKGMPGVATSDKTIRLQQTQFIIDRGLSFSNPVARAAFFDMAYTYMQIVLDKIDGTENEWKSVEKGLNELFSSMSGEYKSKYPALTLAAIKADTNGNANMKQAMGMQIAYKQLAKEGKYGKMPASANASLEQKAINAVKAHRAFWGTPKQAWVGPVTSTKKNALGQIVTRFRSVKVLCDDNGQKVIHNFVVSVTADSGSVSFTGFGWENGSKEIELVK